MKNGLKDVYFGLAIILILTSLAGCVPSHSTVTPTLVATSTAAAPQPTPPTPTLVATSTAVAPQPTPPAPTPVETPTPNDPIAFQSSLTLWAANKPPNYPDSTSTVITVSNEHALAGKQSLALTFDYKKDLKAIFSLEKPFDLSHIQKLYVLFSDPDGVLDSATIALSTGQDWLWHEAVPQKVQPGDNNLVFDLQGDGFQTAATGWKPGAKVANLNQVQRLSIILFPHKAGSAFLQSVRVTAEETAAGAASVICPSLPVIPATTSPLALYLPPGAQPQQFGLLEFDLSTTTVVKNPFDPAQADLVVHYTPPDGKTMTIPAFWYQAYDSTGSSPCGNPGWKARLTPNQAGQWRAQAELLSQGITSEEVAFQVNTSNSKGFVRLSPTNPHYLAFDNGETFFPVGLNIGWWQSDPLKDYQRWMDKLHENNGSIIRVWMADWSFGLEWDDTGLGDYTKRLRQAWLLDQVFNMARQDDIYIELVLLHHGAFSATVNPEWDANPYNSANGGPCDTPQCFVTNAQARQYFQRRLRYIAARWGYSPNLLDWEWWNEEDWTPIQSQQLAPWIKEMTAFLRQYDPYQHLVSTSFAMKNPPEVLGLPEIDFTQVHSYSYQDPMDAFPGIYQDMLAAAPSKPILFAEFGYSAAGENTKSYDKVGDHLHIGLWASTFSGFASPAMYWWWDSYIDPLNLWGQFKTLATFLQSIDMATLSPGKPKLSSSIHARALSLQNDHMALVWVKNVNYIAEALPGMLDKKVQGLSLTLNGLKDGSYRLHWYDPTSGQWVSETSMNVTGSTITLVIPDFNRDLALKIILQ